MNCMLYFEVEKNVHEALFYKFVSTFDQLRSHFIENIVEDLKLFVGFSLIMITQNTVVSRSILVKTQTAKHRNFCVVSQCLKKLEQSTRKRRSKFLSNLILLHATRDGSLCVSFANLNTLVKAINKSTTTKRYIQIPSTSSVAFRQKFSWYFWVKLRFILRLSWSINKFDTKIVGKSIFTVEATENRCFSFTDTIAFNFKIPEMKSWKKLNSFSWHS